MQGRKFEIARVLGGIRPYTSGYIAVYSWYLFPISMHCDYLSVTI